MAALIDPPETRYVTVDEVEVAYQVVGSGPVDLVFHHGMCHVDLQWDLEPEAAFLAALASFSRLIVFDRRGTGASERIAGETLPSWEEWSEDLRAVLDAVGSERATIFAETEAGPTAVLFAAAHPERVSALVLGNTTARFTVADDYPIGLPTEAVELSAAIWETSWGKPELVDLGFPSFRGRDRDVRSLCKLMRAAATPRAAARQYRHVWTMDVRRFLPLVTAPTLVLHSETDAPGVDQARFLAERIPDARFVEVPGHDWLYFGGDFEPVVEEVAEFVTGHRPAPAIERVLTTVLFTDIVGSTDLAVGMGDRRWRHILDAHDRVVRDQLARFRGREINTTGDGFVAAFDGPARAICCARAINAGVRALGVDTRAGVHIGECEVRGEDLAGVAVHIAARVGAAAGPGEVLVTAVVKDLATGSGIEFEDRGTTTLKGVPEPQHLLAITGA